MSVDPLKCVVDKSQKQCVKEITITWPENQYDKLCLYVDNVRRFCSAQGDKNEVVITVESTSNIKLELRHQDKVVDETYFKVLKENSVSLRNRFSPWLILQ
ncbi:DUF3019 domain-containing protein [Thalassotalea sp. LPB0316]|uniref:DUF3019 domain-containing protein n=1 Tax=Thalassotalea sp. LPB0316 TaxID=2769490 RepID=UPI001867D0B5|nr:DUF3019 domain-containing protein [Thalassotalea sp. LPB0316]QOL26125.1 DUF3019 domain-containing protein [Thalassotalea sp. LPB0316]